MPTGKKKSVEQVVVMYPSGMLEHQCEKDGCKGSGRVRCEGLGAPADVKECPLPEFRLVCEATDTTMTPTVVHNR